MALSARKSTMEEMLDSIKMRDERPKDVPPVLPQRPTSKARLPSTVRMRKTAFSLFNQSAEMLSTSSNQSDEAARLNSRETGVSVESALNTAELVQNEHLPVQGVWMNTEGERVADVRLNNGFPMGGGEVGRWKTDEKPRNEVGELDVFNQGCSEIGVDSSMQKSEFDKHEDHRTIDSPYKKIESYSESDCCDLGSPTFSADREGMKWKEDSVSGLNKNSRVWCTILHNQWALGLIQSIHGTESLVSISNGHIVRVPTGKLLPANPEILEGVDDLIQLCYLNEPSFLHNLQHRYVQDMIYTEAGPVLLATNPFKHVSLYDDDFIRAYKFKERDSPHVYKMADNAFAAMMRDGVNQSIIISGESGAGKTETAKIAMQYLAALGGGSGVGNEILQTDAILESFGNAKTLRNDNSSRFGKLIDIHFEDSGKICGAKIRTYLLEKSRVVQRAQGERSYHIFYQLCAGASPALRERLNLRPAAEYCYLNQSNCLTINGVDDARRFHHVLEALNVVQISQEDQENAFRMVAAVLWLGNITFSVTNIENHVKVDNNEGVCNAAKLLGCNAGELMTALSTHKIRAGNEDIVQNLSCSQAADTRDALAKAIYANLFDWLVDHINKSLEVGKCRAGRSISILDMYGFESFKTNSLEQLCINYANERLHQHLNRHLFKLEQEDCCMEGIDWTKFEFKDNQECLDLFEKKPVGIISLLDEESRFQKATNLMLANKLNQQLNGNSCFKGESGMAFCVCHSGGEVVYDTTGFLEKNRDLLHYDLLQLLSSSTSHLPQLFASNISKGAQKYGSLMGRANRAESQRQSVATKFKGQLFKLLQRMEKTSPHFICCIKPNGLQLPGVYEQDLVLQQLRCCGVLEVVRICRSGYPTRILHQQFAKRYGFLVLQNVAAQDALDTCVAIFHRFNITPEMFQVGFTKLFLRTGQIGRLEHIRTRTLHGIVAVQKAFRAFRVRCHFKKLKRVTIFLQSLVRSMRARKEYLIMKERHRAALTIQKRIRCTTARKKYMRAQKMVILVQAVIRGWLARRQMAIILQKLQEGTPVVNMTPVKSIGDIDLDSRNEAITELKLVESVQDLPKESRDLQDVEGKLSGEGIQAEAKVNIQPSSFIADLQNRVLAAEAALKEKEDENAVLRQTIVQYESRWLEYEAKMASMEETWQRQMSSLQLNLAAAKKNLAADEPAIQQAKQGDVLNARATVPRQHATRHISSHDDENFDWEDATSVITKASDPTFTVRKTQHSEPVQHSDIALARELDAGRSAVAHLVKEFEQRTQVFSDDSDFLVEVKSGQIEANLNPDEELRKLKHRFNVWKKAFKVQMRETKGKLHKLGSTDSGDKARKKWWAWH